MRGGHLIDMQELRTREIFDLQQKFYKQQCEVDRRVEEYETLGRQINDLTAVVCSLFSQQILMLFVLAINENFALHVDASTTRHSRTPGEPCS